MSREDQHFRLRLPADLRALVEEAAARNKRSMTAEMIARLEESFETTENLDHYIPKTIYGNILESIISKYENLVTKIESKTNQIESENALIREQIKELSERQSVPKDEHRD